MEKKRSRVTILLTFITSVVVNGYGAMTVISRPFHHHVSRIPMHLAPLTFYSIVGSTPYVLNQTTTIIRKKINRQDPQGGLILSTYECDDSQIHRINFCFSLSNYIIISNPISLSTSWHQKIYRCSRGFCSQPLECNVLRDKSCRE